VDNDDNTPPSVAITSPAHGATVGGTVTITASASDDVGVAKVRFWVDGTYLSYDASAPYTRTWNTAGYADGAHVIRVQAVDHAGNVSDASITVTVAN
jgi:hypothetical protein